MFRNDYNEERFVNSFAEIADSLKAIAARQLASPPPQTKTFENVKNLINNGQTIEAIRLFRQLTQASLKDSKDVVDMLRGLR